MKIIIEGCDGSGKTTLAKKLATIFKAKIEHDSTPQDFRTYMERLNDGQNTIYDRFFLGQFVYNKKEERKLSDFDLLSLKMYCSNRPDIIMIYLDTAIEVLLERLENRSTEEKEKDNKIISKIGVSTPEDFITTIKDAYRLYTDGFMILKGEDLNE